MRLTTFRRPGGTPRPGALLPSGSLMDLSAAGRSAGLPIYTVADVLGWGAPDREALTSLVSRVADDPAEGLEKGWVLRSDDVELLPPTGVRPFFLSCGGLYVSHLKEMGQEGAPPTMPPSYVVNPNVLIGSGQAIVLPPDAGEMVDWEGELCLVFGRPTHRVDAQSAMDHVAGYTIYNDVSARDHVAGVFSSVPGEAMAAAAANLRYKVFPTFGPLGPCVVTVDEVPDIEKARLTTTVNGTVMQEDLAGNLHMSIAQAIAAISEVQSFAVGDIMSLGTPAGVGYGRTPKVFLQPGDVVEVSVDGIGTLRNPVVAAGAS